MNTISAKDFQKTFGKAIKKPKIGPYSYIGTNPLVRVDNEGYITVNIKPLSQNDAWKGQRFKSKLYKQYEEILLKVLPSYNLRKDCQYKVYYQFGFSNMASDLDNPVKALTDILQKKYGFNDKHIMEAHIIKKIVEKGQEYFTVKFIIIN